MRERARKKGREMKKNKRDRGSKVRVKGNR